VWFLLAALDESLDSSHFRFMVARLAGLSNSAKVLQQITQLNTIEYRISIRIYIAEATKARIVQPR